jgi:hypothetical protein
VQRDVYQRGRDVTGILYQYNRFVKPAYMDYIHPTMKRAHLIIPGRVGNNISIQNVTQFLARRLKDIDVSPVKEVNAEEVEKMMDLQWKIFANSELAKNNCIFLEGEDLKEAMSLTKCLLVNEFSKTLFK